MLKTIQTTFSNDVINDQVQGDYFSQGNFSAAELIQIYRNHYILSLIGTLKSSYSCILRLVGEGFFTLLAKNYISEHPLSAGYLQNYGHFFAQFLKGFKPCKPYPYLIDIVYFERYYE
ncbi:DNA-binding domain-containing protein [Abyssogena phaseoliformis symbiont]|uniref:HvfC/BufC N-terminal domain-containing protein n=1 Tax=Abyssogena phaseoliformis symbiont TaxID=596095 RepID=UPI0019155944|nr:DNA-binding domain-containing protein [Abyssogena phaseoliformis symbiont]